MFGRLYILVVRVRDLFGLVVSQLVTVFGMVEFRSVDEVVNRRNPARFMRWSARKRLLNQFNGGFLLDGKVGRLSRGVSYRSLITTGGMGTGKSANLILPNLLSADDCSLVINDTSGELYEQTSGYLAAKGYDIRVLNLIDSTRGHGYNPLANVASYSDAERIAHILTKSAGGGGHSSEPIWDDGAKRLVRILVRALKNSPKADTANLADVKFWLDHFDVHKQASLQRFTGRPPFFRTPHSPTAPAARPPLRRRATPAGRVRCSARPGPRRPVARRRSSGSVRAPSAW